MSSSWNSLQNRKWRRGQQRDDEIPNVRSEETDNEKNNSYETVTAGETQLVDSMSGSYPSGHSVPMNMKGGPGLSDPLIARQKNHHRRAFELISKALRIDESDAGKSKNLKIPTACLKLDCQMWNLFDL